MASEDRRFFAWAYARFNRVGERAFVDRRRALLAHAEDRVVEIGAGTGANLSLYPATVSEVIVTEPDRHMLKRLAKVLTKASVPVRLERAAADALPLRDGSADTVVSTLVLCSVPDQIAALAEAYRVLRPGGWLLFMEHMRSEDPRIARRQDRWAPVQSRIAGGCHPNRDTLAAIRAAGFEVVDVERSSFPGPKVTSPHISGRARKPG